MWQDNGDGTWTAEKGDSLWGLYGTNWKEKSGYSGDPTKLKPGDVVGKAKKGSEAYSDGHRFEASQSASSDSSSESSPLEGSFGSSGNGASFGYGTYFLDPNRGEATFKGFDVQAPLLDLGGIELYAEGKILCGEFGIGFKDGGFTLKALADVFSLSIGVKSSSSSLLPFDASFGGGIAGGGEITITGKEITGSGKWGVGASVKRGQ